LAAESGWLVKRVSLKSRNASRAQPDHSERAAQQIFNNLRQQVSRQVLQQEKEEPAS